MPRIGFFESISEVVDRIAGILGPIATANNLTFHVLPADTSSHAQSSVSLHTFGVKIEPAPITPVEGRAFDLMGGTIKQQFPGTVVVPSAMTAFTDTQCELLSPLDRIQDARGGANTDRLLGFDASYLPLPPCVHQSDQELPHSG